MTRAGGPDWETRRSNASRDPGDAWVYSPSGQRYWGRFGAAGLLALDPERGVLLQHRAEWSHHGGTWGIPGGALHEGESAAAGALRESAEEAGVPEGSVAPRFTSVLELGYWRYTTLVADVVAPFEPVLADSESLELRWVPVDEVDSLPLHHGFAAAWPALRAALAMRPVVIVDAANLVGSVPDGWWRDRAGAAERLLTTLAAFSADDAAGVPAEDLSASGSRWFPQFSVVVEGAAKEARAPERLAKTLLVRAEASGDDAIVAETLRHAADGATITVATSDRELAARVAAVGADVRGVAWLRDLIGYGRRQATR